MDYPMLKGVRTLTINAKQAALDYLDRAGISYERMDHAPVFTMEEMEAQGITERGGVVKNLFLRDAKGKNHYLVVVPEEKQINLIALAQQLDSTKLSFASAERLEKYLGVAQGSVSPLGVLNDAGHVVQVAFDRDLKRQDRIGIHPNDNTSTIWLALQDLMALITNLGNQVSLIDIK